MKIKSRQYAEALLDATDKEDLSKVAEKLWHKLQKDNNYKELPKILKNLEVVYAEKNDMILAKVLSPVPLKDKDIQSINKIIKDTFKKNAYIDNIIDPTLEFGYRIEVEDKVFDNTFSGKINKLKTFIS